MSAYTSMYRFHIRKLNRRLSVSGVVQMGESKKQESDTSEPPQLVVQQFSMEALYHITLQNNDQMLGLYDEMTVMYDAYKHYGSTLDRSTLLDLYNGGSIVARNFKNKNGPSKLLETAFNMAGFCGQHACKA